MVDIESGISTVENIFVSGGEDDLRGRWTCVGGEVENWTGGGSISISCAGMIEITSSSPELLLPFEARGRWRSAADDVTGKTTSSFNSVASEVILIEGVRMTSQA